VHELLAELRQRQTRIERHRHRTDVYDRDKGGTPARTRIDEDGDPIARQNACFLQSVCQQGHFVLQFTMAEVLAIGPGPGDRGTITVTVSWGQHQRGNIAPRPAGSELSLSPQPQADPVGCDLPQRGIQI
jgi:hypothetical protein